MTHPYDTPDVPPGDLPVYSWGWDHTRPLADGWAMPKEGHVRRRLRLPRPRRVSLDTLILTFAACCIGWYFIFKVAEAFVSGRLP